MKIVRETIEQIRAMDAIYILLCKQSDICILLSDIKPLRHRGD